VSTTTPVPQERASTASRLSADIRQAYDLAIAGAAGALFGLYVYVEMMQARYAEAVYALPVHLRDALAGLAIGGAVGFFLNAAGPYRDRAWLKLARAAARGALAGALGGAAGLLFGEVVIGWFKGGLAGRSVSWAVLGLAIGASQGVVERSRQRLAFGALGGLLGGAVGGYLFEALRVAMGNRYDLSQGLGIVILGAGLGTGLALVEQALRRAWVVVLSGRQEGRSYLLDQPTSALGLDERAEIGLFADRLIARRHAAIEATARGFLLRDFAGGGRTRVNGEPIQGEPLLKDGDRIELGQTLLVFRQR
jgi:hypothetical protein